MLAFVPDQDTRSHLAARMPQALFRSPLSSRLFPTQKRTPFATAAEMHAECSTQPAFPTEATFPTKPVPHDTAVQASVLQLLLRWFRREPAVLPQNRPVRNRPTNPLLSMSSRFVLSVNKICRRLDSTPHEALTSMPDRSQQPAIILSLPPEEQWTLHHVLLDRIDQKTTVGDTAEVDPPPVEVFRAFETLDAGETSFTIAQLEAIQDVLAEYHHSPTWWEIERPQFEQLLQRTARLIEQH